VARHGKGKAGEPVATRDEPFAQAVEPESNGHAPVSRAVDPEANEQEVGAKAVEPEANGHEPAPHIEEVPEEAGSVSGDGEQASTEFVDLINEALSPRQTLPGFADPRVEHVNSIELPPWFIDRCRQAYLSVRFDSSAECRVIGVTSGSYGEGKTSVAIGTAIAMAVDSNKPTLLIECDFAEPTLYKFFGIDRGRGLGEWLDGGARLRIVRGAALVPNVFVIPSGTPQSEPARFLYELVDREVMVGLRSCFGNVVIDLPPALNISYGSLAYALADHLLIVARSGVTLTEDLERLVSLIGRDRVSGIVLNGTDNRTPGWLRQLL
jgi:Mrp family chromosome partitioning ATPase